MKKILIGGLPQHGKSTVAELLARRFGVSFANTSDTIYEEAAIQLGLPVDDVRGLPKEEIRSLLIKTGDALCDKHGLAYLTLCQLAKHDIVCGVRKPKELALVRAQYPDALFLWVIRPGQPEIKDSTALSHLDADAVLVNSGSKHDLETQATRAVVQDSLGLRHPGNSLWNLLHWFAFKRDWSEQERINFMRSFETLLMITGGDCPCAMEFAAIKKVLPPPPDQGEFWNWTLLVHDWVNHRRGVPPKWDWTAGHPGFIQLREAFSTGTAESILTGRTPLVSPTSPIEYCSPCAK